MVIYTYVYYTCISRVCYGTVPIPALSQDILRDPVLSVAALAELISEFLLEGT